MELRQSLEIIFNECYREIVLSPIDLDILSSTKRILIIRSAGMGLLIKFIRKVRLINPDIHFTILSHPSDFTELKRECNNNCEIIEYKYSESFNIQNLKDELNNLKQMSIDSFLLLYNNRYGMGYSNVEEILYKIANRPFYAFNSYSELLEVNNPALHIESLKMIDQASSWFWEKL